MNIAIILSGGVGTRMGADIPKQYIEVNGKPIISYCLQTFLKVQTVDIIVIGIAEEWESYVKEIVKALKPQKKIFYAEPGETRQYSIYNALKVVKEIGGKDNDLVIIHDAARPLVSEELIQRCFEGCKEADGVLPVILVKDTIYQSTDKTHITNLLNRSELFAGQAPEAFHFGKYLQLHQEMPREELLKINGSTEIAYKGGLNIKLVPGDEMNFKITTPEDLSNFESILSKNESIRTTRH